MVKKALILIFILTSVIYSQTDEQKFIYNIGVSYTPAFFTNNLKSNVFNDYPGLDKPFGNFLIHGFSPYIGAEYQILESNSSFFRKSFIYSGFGMTILKGVRANEQFVGKHFLYNELEPVYIANSLETNINVIFLRLGVSNSTAIKNLSVFSGFNIGYTASRELRLETKLKNNDIEFDNDDNDASQFKDYSDDLSLFYGDFHIGTQYRFYESESSSVDLTLSANIGLNNLLSESNSYSLRINSINLGVEFNLFKYSQKPVVTKPPMPEAPLPDPPKIKKFAIKHRVDNTNNDICKIYSDKNLTDVYFILHPNIYFENDDKTKPDINYKLLNRMSKKGYELKRKNNNLMINDFREFHNDILNQIGYYVYNNTNEILTINYPKFSMNKEAVNKRVELFKNYFNDVWNISEKRINTKEKNIASNLIEFDYNSISNPIVYENKEAYNISSNKIKFDLEFPDKPISNWEFKLQHYQQGGLVTVFDTSGYQKANSFDINLRNRDDIILSDFNKIQYTFSAEFQEGTREEILNRINIDLFESNEKVYVIEGKLSDIKNNSNVIKKLIEGKSDYIIYAPIRTIAVEASKILGINNYEYEAIKNEENIIYNDYIKIKIME